jgi:hypothetical protein
MGQRAGARGHDPARGGLDSTINSSGSRAQIESIGDWACRQLALRQPLGDWLDALEGSGDAPLVVGQAHADRHRLGDEQQPIGVGSLQLDGARETHHVLRIRADGDSGGLALAIRQRLPDAGPETGDQPFLFDWRQAEEHGGAELKENHSPAARRAEAEGAGRKSVLALEGLTLAISMTHPDGRAIKGLIPMPGQLDRFIRLPSEEGDKTAIRFMRIETMIGLFLSELFPTFQINAQGSGEEWRAAPSWPPIGETRALYLAAAGVLADAPGPEGEDRYKVDFTVGTDTNTRHERLAARGHARLLCRLAGKGRAHAALHLGALPHDTEVAGHPVVDLWLSSSEGMRPCTSTSLRSRPTGPCAT